MMKPVRPVCPSWAAAAPSNIYYGSSRDALSSLWLFKNEKPEELWGVRSGPTFRLLQLPVILALWEEKTLWEGWHFFGLQIFWEKKNNFGWHLSQQSETFLWFQIGGWTKMTADESCEKTICEQRLLSEDKLSKSITAGTIAKNSSRSGLINFNFCYVSFDLQIKLF